jgi:hypothetical protein
MLKQTRGATRPKRAWVAQPIVHAAPVGLVWPSGVVSSSSFYGCLRFDEKGTSYYSHNFLRWQWWNSSSTFGRVILLPPEGNHRHRHHRLLLGVGGSISITSSTPSSLSPTSAPSPPRDSMSPPYSLW